MQMKVLFLSLTLEQTTPSLFSSNGVLTDLLPIKKAVLLFFFWKKRKKRGSHDRLRYFLPPERVRYSPLPPCDSTAALLSAHSRKGKNTPCEPKASATLKTLFGLIDDTFKKHTHVSFLFLFQLPFLFLGTKTKKFARTVRSQSS